MIKFNEDCTGRAITTHLHGIEVRISTALLAHGKWTVLLEPYIGGMEWKGLGPTLTDALNDALEARSREVVRQLLRDAQALLKSVEFVERGSGQDEAFRAVGLIADALGMLSEE